MLVGPGRNRKPLEVTEAEAHPNPSQLSTQKEDAQSLTELGKDPRPKPGTFRPAIVFRFLLSGLPGLYMLESVIRSLSE